MEFTIEEKVIEDELSKIINVVTTSDSLSKCLLLSTNNDALLLSTMSANLSKEKNNDSRLVAYVKVELKDKPLKQGDFLLDARLFYNLLKQISRRDVLDFFIAGKRNPTLNIKNINNKYEFELIKESYPQPDTDSYFYNTSIDLETFISMLDCSGWAYSIDDNEHREFEHILFEFKDDTFSIMSSDSRKFANSTISFKFIEDMQILIPYKVIDSVYKYLNKIYKQFIKDKNNSMPPVKILIGNKFIKFNCENVYFVGEISSLKYPPIKDKAEKINKYPITIKKRLLLNTLKRLTPFTDNVKRMLIFDLKKDKNIKIYSYNIYNDKQSIEEIETQWQYPDFKVGFKGNLFEQILTHTKTDDVNLIFQEELMPFKIMETDNNFDFYLLQALRI